MLGRPTDDAPDGEAQPEFAGIAEAAAAAGLVGLPRGLRLRSGTQRLLVSPVAEPDPDAPEETVLGLRGPTRREICALGVFVALSAVITCHFLFRQAVPPAPYGEAWRRGCQQCTREWWKDFWRWRLEGIKNGSVVGEHAHRAGHAPPPGMEWEWGGATNDTDWFGASAELVNEVVLPHTDPSLGPILQIGCGDSPLPGLLHKAGLTASEHIDVAPQVVEAMRKRYPADEWPGLHFEVRDFMANAKKGGGAPPPAHRFAAVIDKAGIWDWLQDEKAEALPQLLAAVHDALVPPPQRGVYVVATKQSPGLLSETLAKAARSGASFAVDATQPLGTSGIAWAYVLMPL